MVFDGLTGVLLKVELRKGSVYTSRNVAAFLKPVHQWFRSKFPEIQLILRGDSGFAINADKWKISSRKLNWISEWIPLVTQHS